MKMALRAAGWHGAARLICVLLPLTVALFSVGVVGIQEEKPVQEQPPVEVIAVYSEKRFDDQMLNVCEPRQARNKHHINLHW